MIDKISKKIETPELESVSGMDATFLYGETETSPMHVGSVAIIEGSLEFENFKKIILSRIHHIPKLRKRLMFVPLSIDYPYWVDDPNFDIGMHINHVALPKPGSWQELRNLASKIFSEPLDRSRPLWEFTFVEGLDNMSQVKSGSVAVIAKIHHVAIDGVAGAGLLAILFDMFPNTKPIPEPKEYKPNELPSELSLMVKSGMSFTKKPLKFPQLLKDAVTATAKAGFLTRVQHMDLPTAPFTAPSTPINGIIAARRKWNTSIISLDRVKRLKNIMGTTLNDILLAICAGALRKYLIEKEKLPRKPLVAMVPVSTRNVEDSNGTGNQLSAMLIQLATDIEDPIERLELIYENTVRGKTYQGAMGAKSLSNIAEVVPFGIANQAARFYTRYHLAKLHNPVFNVVITNVPGPQMPIYLHGHKLHSIMGMAPIIDGMGLIITILSYNGNITISPTSDINSMPDLNHFSKLILQEANDLEKIILKYEKNKGKRQVKTKDGKQSSTVKPESDKFFDAMKTFIKREDFNHEMGDTLIQFHIKGDIPRDWRIDFGKNPVSIRRGKAVKANVSFTIKDNHLLKFLSGKMDYETALLQGRILFIGDSKKARIFGNFLDEFVQNSSE